MHKKKSPLVVTINSAGRQAASFVRVASAVGWRVRAQLRKDDGLMAEELGRLPNVSLIQHDLDDSGLIENLFQDAQMAFVNTTHWGNEVDIGHALANAAKRAGVKHYIYSSMPDHSTFGRGWKALPLWAQKFKVEEYIRTLNMPSTFVYAGIYNNNFTTLPYPLFRLEVQPDRSLIWQAPFHPDEPLPWLDAEHDVGPALLQIFKEGPERWDGHRIPLTFEVLSPHEVCAAFTRALSRSVTYCRGPVEIAVPIPSGYREHLETLEQVLGNEGAPYFGPDMYYPNEAIQLWEGNRSMEEYAREEFLEEERANGQSWMEEEGAVISSELGEDEGSSIIGADESITGSGKIAELKFTGSC